MKINKRFRNMLLVFGIIPVAFMISPIVFKILEHGIYKEIYVYSDGATAIVAILYIALIINWSEQGD